MSPSTWDDPYRLPRWARPTRYDVELQPDLEAARFRGTVRIELDVDPGVTELLLNAAELEIDAATVDDAPVTVALDADTQRAHVPCPTPLAAGPHTLTLAFRGTLNDKLRGFYRSTFLDTDGASHVIAASQMQPTDCRKAFPCWDEPDFKAVFAVTLVVESGLPALSNGAEVERMARPDGRVAVRFADTMPMSTYLVAFIVGPLETTPEVLVDGVPVRIAHVPGKDHLTPFGLEIAVAALRWFQDYYGIRYPGDKVDLVALPDFAAGAMENLGCITFRESLLLVDPSTATQHEQQLVADVVAHELAHMWFGDLVTMRWWNGIWLNEAFATFMEVAAVDELRPDWHRWEHFGLERTAAFDTDSLGTTRSVEYEVHSPADSEGMFDVLTYQKGGALLRMLQQYLGDEPFRAGVSHYLRTHELGNTETSDLWDAIEETTGEPVRRIMDSWIWQRGYPLVRADLDGTDLVLRQRRFGFLDAVRDEPTLWAIPVHVRNGDVELRILLDEPEARLALPHPDAEVVVNAGGFGFYRVAYDDALRARLGGPGLAGMTTLERYGLVDDAWNAVIDGDLDAPGFLRFAEGFAGEDQLPVWQALAAGLRGVGRLLDGEPLERFRGVVRRIAGPALERVGWDPHPGEGDLTATLRGVLVSLVAVLGDDADAQARCRALFDLAHHDPHAVHPELAAVATNVVAATGGPEHYERILAAFRTASTPQDQIRHLYALAEFDDEDLVLRTCELAFSAEVKTQNAPFLLGRCIANRFHGVAAWRFVRQHWTEANERFPLSTIIRMVDPVKLLSTPEAAADVEAFFAEHPVPQATATLRQILERQQVNVALREREAPNLKVSLT